MTVNTQMSLPDRPDAVFLCSAGFFFFFHLYMWSYEAEPFNETEKMTG